MDAVRKRESLPDNQLSWWEKVSLWCLGIIILVTVSAFISQTLAPGNALQGILDTYFLDPIRDESLADGSYNQINTMAYNVTLILSVISIGAIMRWLRMPATECTILALIPWVFWAALGEVVEDASLFGAGLQPWFVSPGIHFQGALWVVVTGWLSVVASRAADDGGRSWVTGMSIGMVAFQGFLFLTSLQDGRIGTPMEDHLNLWPVGIAGLLATFFILASHPMMERWTAVEQGLFQVGIGGCLVLYGCLHAYASMMSGLEVSGDLATIFAIDRTPEMNLEVLLWTMALPAVILLLPIIYLSLPVREKLRRRGISVPGLLPPGLDLTSYENERTQYHDDMESLAGLAVLSSPIVFLAIYGQAVDGIATGMGLEIYGYTEKHVLSAAVIGIFGSAYGFTVLKVALGFVVWWFYALQRWEYRYRHLRILMGLALMTVGLAPGLRDAFRMALGV
tara:strand:- start:3371 stop:4726 length:1356 start_codon:yes stop_codon:yes gene_type:complete